MMLSSILLAGAAVAASPEPTLDRIQWFDDERCRLVVRVDPIPLDGRVRDELVASLDFDLHEQLRGLTEGSFIDLHSLQVMRVNPHTGEPQPYRNNAYQASPCDRPFRFYDRSLLDEFPLNQTNMSYQAQQGRPLLGNGKKTVPFGHRQFNPAVKARVGTLVWVHTQDRSDAAYYAISFDVLDASESALNPPAGFIGDGGNRIVKDTARFGPTGNVLGSAADFNSDGLPDIIAGSASGNVVVNLNTGSVGSPRFDTRVLLYGVDGRPIDVGWDAYPHQTDWNGDGKTDLLIGAARGCIAYYQNVGSATEPQFRFTGTVEADGEMLVTPNWPIVGIPEEGRGTVFKADYTAFPFAVDWNGDGRTDLLVGGFVTGRVYFFENIGTHGDGTPILTSRGPLIDDATGEPLSTGWGAQPFALDLNGDGLLDLSCGAKPITPTGGDRSDPTANLYYFENAGGGSQPRVAYRPFPSTRPSPTGSQLNASVMDLNGDGLLDLVLLSRAGELFLVRNIGTEQAPLFDMDVAAHHATWNNEPMPRGRLVDWNGDGFSDLMGTFSVSLSDGKGLPGTFSRAIRLMPAGQRISHPIPHGDENPGILMHDFDRDGVIDCVYGTHGGEIWLHRNRGTHDKPDWDLEGVRLRLASGDIVQVGQLPEDKDPQLFDFYTLQGARPKPTAGDFNGDGYTDLVVADTYGKVRLYLNIGTNQDPLFDEPRIIFSHSSRLSAQTMDFNGDGRDDVFVIRGSQVLLLENDGDTSTASFKEPREITIAEYTTGSISDITIGDFNGDGDADFLVQTSHRLTGYIEGSFLKHGYQPASVIDAAARRD